MFNIQQRPGAQNWWKESDRFKVGSGDDFSKHYFETFGNGVYIG